MALTLEGPQAQHYETSFLFKGVCSIEKTAGKGGIVIVVEKSSFLMQHRYWGPQFLWPSMGPHAGELLFVGP